MTEPAERPRKTAHNVKRCTCLNDLTRIIYIPAPQRHIEAISFLVQK